MTATALDTFDVDATLLQTRLAQVGMEGTGDVLTSATVTSLVEDAASEVCGALIAAGLPVSDIAADTASVAYRQVQRLICDMAVPLIWRALTAPAVGPTSDIEKLEDRARARLDRFASNPTLLGYDSVADTSPGAWSQTSDYADLADTHAANTRDWTYAIDGTHVPEW